MTQPKPTIPLLQQFRARVVILRRHWRRNPFAAIEVVVWSMALFTGAGLGFSTIAGEYTWLISTALVTFAGAFAVEGLREQWKEAVLEELQYLDWATRRMREFNTRRPTH